MRIYTFITGGIFKPAVFFRVVAIIMMLAITSCRSIISEKFVYLISNFEIDQNELVFTVKNTALKNFRSFVVYVEFSKTDSSNYDTDVTVIEKQFISDLKTGESDDFYINLSNENFLFNITSEELENAVCENSIYIQKIFLKEILFEDESTFYDKYGSWSF